MKNHLLFIVVQLCTLFSFGQISHTSPWVWMNGDNSINKPGNYGTQGVAATSNKPGARNFSTTWVDASGSLWLFGGAGYGTSVIGYLNDLWKFDPFLNKWIWIHGDSTTGQHGVYGTQSVAAGVNKPGAAFGSISWTDTSHNLWLFGGYGYGQTHFGFLNTVWKYNPYTNEWTWVNGDSTVNELPDYGIQGVESASNRPGARYGSQTWTDASGQLWLYGGYGFDTSGTEGILNDIWKYNPLTNRWTWINGDMVADQPAVYGSKGVPAATNKPGARYVSSSWIDQDENLWLFGGFGYDENNCGDLNDLWKYDPVSNQWTWMNGDNVIDQPGQYGEKGVAGASNKPGARYVSSSWKDAYGQIWMFGGYGYAAAGNAGYLNDLWNYDPVNNTWTWVKGDNMIDQFGVYGTLGLPDPANKSGARTGSVSWADGAGNLWLFGGYGYDGTSSGALNDLWKINGAQFVLPIHLLHFSGSLQNEMITLRWETEDETGFSHFNIQRSFDGVHFSNMGLVTGAGSSNRHAYNWPDHELGRHNWQKVYYRLQLINQDGKSSCSKVILFNRSGAATALSLYPNPVADYLNLSFVQSKPANVSIRITDMRGVAVMQQTERVAAGRVSMQMDVHALPAGAYLITAFTGDQLLQQQLIKQ